MYKFDGGIILFTKGVNDKVAEDIEFSKFIIKSLNRHLEGDWGDLPPEDIQENELALKEGYRLFSAYTFNSTIKVWIITEWNRSCTTILFPSEY
jgi:hypothetical protein